ncbi:MAG TPA: T9SS type A sorting domain-containing protein [Ignavibacteriaceae bacterium]|jgi:hypothetical protein|nr:T9SS type A sorting domain-containing protein [Ignavibacteriaceae bacterium]HQI42477.1 T9SS type A sorting domain-containing protein [Ignavibacteriaceae bacterium]
MKTFFVIEILFILLFDSNFFAQSNCYTPPSTWHRAINQPVYRWYWDGELNGAVFEGYDHNLTLSEKQNIVRNAIIWAVNSWKNAVNAYGTVIENMSETTNNNANFHFTFTPLSNQAGFTPNSTEVQLASNVIWTDVYSYATAGNAVDIRTVILHEMGHIFLGGGHSTDDGTSLMWDNYRPFRYITDCDRQALLNLYPLFNITIDNNFTDNTGNGTHGKVGIGGYVGNQTAPITIKKAPGQNVTLTAISPQIDNQSYQMVWHTGTTNPSDWKKDGMRLYTNQSYTFAVTNTDNNTTYQAQLRKICKPNFQNSFVSIGNGGVINVNGSQYNSPTEQFDVIELNPINGSAVSGQILNGISYTFDHWSDGSTTVNKTFYPNSTKTYTAYYKGKPSTANRNLTMGNVVGQPIVLNWNEHFNPYVTKYQIWKKVKHNGVMGSEYLIATKNRGTTSYTDYDYSLTNGYTSDLLFYDVRPYYSIEDTYSDPHWIPVYGEISLFKSSDSLLTTNQQIENSLSNYPNPFNPITTINFSIKESGLVNIKVFDLLGQQIAELVNEEKEAGSYSVYFNASNLPSGVYIYSISSKNYNQTRKMLLMK